MPARSSLPASVVVTLCLLATLSVMACRLAMAPAPVGTTAPTDSPATQLTVVPAATATAPVGPCSISSSSPDVQTRPSSRANWCGIVLPLEGYKVAGYSLAYPEDWTVRVAGVEGTNLMFNEGNSRAPWQVFVGLTMTDLPLERAGEATYGYERSGPEPLVAPEETILDKRLANLGGRPVLVLSTSRDDLSIRRYFLLYQAGEGKLYRSTLYMFEVRIPRSEAGTGKYVDFLRLVEEVVASITMGGDANSTVSPGSTTVTPMATLTVDTEQALVLELLNSNAGCRLPCWWGITPGRTTWEAANAYFASLGKTPGLYQGESFTNYSVQFGVPEHDMKVGEVFNVSNGLVDLISVSSKVVHNGEVVFEDEQQRADWHRYMLPELLATYGQPTEVYIWTMQAAPAPAGIPLPAVPAEVFGAVPEVLVRGRAECMHRPVRPLARSHIRAPYPPATASRVPSGDHDSFPGPSMPGAETLQSIAPLDNSQAHPWWPRATTCTRVSEGAGCA